MTTLLSRNTSHFPGRARPTVFRDPGHVHIDRLPHGDLVPVVPRGSGIKIIFNCGHRPFQQTARIHGVNSPQFCPRAQLSAQEMMNRSDMTPYLGETYTVYPIAVRNDTNKDVVMRVLRAGAEQRRVRPGQEFKHQMFVNERLDVISDDGVGFLGVGLRSNGTFCAEEMEDPLRMRRLWAGHFALYHSNGGPDDPRFC